MSCPVRKDWEQVSVCLTKAHQRVGRTLRMRTFVTHPHNLQNTMIHNRCLPRPYPSQVARPESVILLLSISARGARTLFGNAQLLKYTDTL